MPSDKPQYFPEYRIYKPRQTGDGAASRLQFKILQGKYGPKHILFWEATKQIGFDDNKNAKFGWLDQATKVAMKLEEPDIGEILSVLNGYKDYVGTDPKKGMYHQNDNGNTVMMFTKTVKDNMPPVFYLRLSAKRKDVKDAVIIQHVISLSEAMIVKILLQDAVSRMFGWGF